MVLTSDRSLLHILERWLEGSQALDRLHCHISTVLRTYHRTDFISLRRIRSHLFVEFNGSKKRINQVDLQSIPIIGQSMCSTFAGTCLSQSASKKFLHNLHTHGQVIGHPLRRLVTPREGRQDRNR